MLFTAIICPISIYMCKIIPIKKNAKGALTSFDKYCSIANSSVIGKMLYHMIIDRQSEFLKTSDYQCGLIRVKFMFDFLCVCVFFVAVHVAQRIA